MKIIVASKNQVKINAALEGFQRMFPNETIEIEGVSVSSDVSEQPMSDEETKLGAYNRAENAYKNYPNADFWIGLEGGIEKVDSEMMAFSWVYIKSNDLIGKGRTASYFLPKQITDLINEGKELGQADDIVFARSNSKQSNGAIGILTENIVTRSTLLSPAVIMALVPFKNKDLY